MKKIIIVAIAEDGCIGMQGKLPWHYKDDLAWFKHNTIGHGVVMGRNTFKSIGKALPDRVNIVLSSKKILESTSLYWCRNLSEAYNICNQHNCEKCFVMGGRGVYEEAISDVDEILLTKIPGKYPDGDVFFPSWPFDDSTWPNKELIVKTSSNLEFWKYRRGQK